MPKRAFFFGTVVLVLPLIAPVYVQAQSAAPNPGRDNDRIVKYVYKRAPQAELAMYVHLPPGWTEQDKRPAIIFFFGGGWTSGTFYHFMYQATYFASRGIVSVRADYRVSSRHGTLPDSCVEDGKSAIRWLRGERRQAGRRPEPHRRRRWLSRRPHCRLCLRSEGIRIARRRSDGFFTTQSAGPFQPSA